MPRGEKNLGRLKHDLTGQRFGRLVVLGFAGRWGKGQRAYFRCKCDCGGFVVAQSENLRRGRTASCGCLRKQMARMRQLAAAEVLRVLDDKLDRDILRERISEH